MTIVKYSELRKRRVIAFDGGAQLNITDDDKNIEIWHNFETICSVNMDSVTQDFANQIFENFNLEIDWGN